MEFSIDLIILSKNCEKKVGTGFLIRELLSSQLTFLLKQCTIGGNNRYKKN